MKKDKITLILSIVLASMCTLAGCGSLKKITINDLTQKVCPVSGISIDDGELSNIKDKIPVHLYYADKENKLKLSVKYIPKTEGEECINALATRVVCELIKKPQDKDLRATIPNGTKMVRDVKVVNNTAYVDFSEEFIKNHKGGKEEEQLTIFSVVNSLTDLKGVDKVHFKIEGKSKKEYKGNFIFDRDFKRGIAITNVK